MSTFKPLICPICNKTSKTPHYRTCDVNLQKKDFKMVVLKFNYPNIDLTRDSIYDLYVRKELSTTDFYSIFGMYHKTLFFILDYYQIPKRNLSQANNTDAVKEKFKSTCLEKYGTTNVLSKNAPGYNNRKQNLKTRYGVVNVFQLKDVQDKITQTHLIRYGKKRVNPFEHYTDEQLYSVYKKKIDTMISNNTLPKFHRINKLETRVSECLTLLGISFQYSFFLKRHQFDFKIQNVLLEVHGDFWHANPTFYVEDSLLHFPGSKTLISAGSIWYRDEKKKKLAENNNFHYLCIWENEINGKTDNELEQFLIDKLSLVLELHPL